MDVCFVRGQGRLIVVLNGIGDLLEFGIDADAYSCECACGVGLSDALFGALCEGSLQVVGDC